MITPLRRSGMARVLNWSHSFTCTPRVHPLTEWTIPLPSQPKLVLIYRPQRNGRLSWSCVITYPNSIRTCAIGVLLKLDSTLQFFYAKSLRLRWVQLVDRSLSADRKFKVITPVGRMRITNTRSAHAKLLWCKLFISLPVWSQWTWRCCSCSRTVPCLSRGENIGSGAFSSEFGF